MIAHKLLETGILQFGLFVEANQNKPYRLRLEMLSAYPHLMQQVIYRTIQALPTQTFDRLVSHSDCVPIASAISLNTGISLVYSRGCGEISVHDLVGAYDIGHPACLIVNTWDESMNIFLADCHRVGLKIHSIVEIIGLGQVTDGITHHSVYTLEAILHELYLSKTISEEHIQSIQPYIEKNI